MIASRHTFFPLHAIKPVMNKMNMLVCSLGVICTVCIATANAGAIVVYPNMLRPGEKAQMAEKLETAKNLLDSVKQSIQQQIADDNEPNITRLGKCAKELANYVPNYGGPAAPQCDANGDYRKRQCRFNGAPTASPPCYCVDPQTGGRTPEWGAPIEGHVLVDCERKSENAKAKTCAESVANWDWGLGLPKPTCDANGDYERMQCETRWPRCYCVDRRTGERLWRMGAAVDGEAKRVDCERRRVKKGECDEKLAMWNGRIDLDGGNGPPACDANGNYKKVQCSGSTRHCWCVDATTGREIANTSKLAMVAPGPNYPDCDGDTKGSGACAKKLAEMVAREQSTGQQSVFPGKPQCDERGNYRTKQCAPPTVFDGGCWCVEALGGAPIPGTQFGGIAGLPGVDCDAAQTAGTELCQKELLEWMAAPGRKELGVVDKPMCDGNGNYRPAQSDGLSPGFSWCVGQLSGERVPHSMRYGDEPIKPYGGCNGPFHKGRGKCAYERARASPYSRYSPAVPNAPACDADGHYAKRQCAPPRYSNGARRCRCVRPLTGEQLAGTARTVGARSYMRNHCD